MKRAGTVGIYIPAKIVTKWSAKKVYVDNLEDHLNQLQSEDFNINDIGDMNADGFVLVTATKVVKESQNA